MFLFLQTKLCKDKNKYKLQKLEIIQTEKWAGGNPKLYTIVNVIGNNS